MQFNWHDRKWLYLFLWNTFGSLWLDNEQWIDDGPETRTPVGNQVENQLSSSTGGGFTQTHHRTGRASYLSQPWCERGLGEKKERRGNRRWQRTQLQYLLVLWWYMFFHIRKACHQKHSGHFQKLLLHHRAATRKQGIVFTLGPHGQQLTFTK